MYLQQLGLRLSFAIVVTFAATMETLAQPYAEFYFKTPPENGELRDDSGAGLLLKLGKTTKFHASAAPSGNGCISFNGDADSVAVFDSTSQAAKRLQKSDFAVSLWVRLNEKNSKDSSLGLGFKAPPVLELDARRNDGTSTAISSKCDRTLCLGQWHHMAYSFSFTNGLLTYYFDGRLQKHVKFNRNALMEISDVMLIPLGKNISADVADIKLWDRVPKDRELVKFSPSDAEIKRTGTMLSEASKLLAQTSFTRWILTQTGETANVHDWLSHAYLAENAMTLAELSQSAASVKTLTDAPFIPMQIYPFSTHKRLPYDIPHDATATIPLKLSAAIGEFESASFMLFPLENIRKSHVSATDLISETNKIRSSEIDIKIVKVWHTPDGTWSSDRTGDIGFPTLISSILLHDDSLIRVDETNRINYLRIDYPEGTQYVNMTRVGRKETFNTSLHPVNDAATLLPLDLTKNRLQQFWLTAKIPHDAAPGIYSGRLVIRKDGTNGPVIGEIPMQIEVYPFQLPRPATHYDIDKEYICSVMHGNSVAAYLAESKDLAHAKLKCANAFRNMAEHNILHPSGPGIFTTGEENDPAVMTLRLMQEAGLPLDIIFNGFGCDVLWFVNDGNPQSPEADPQAFTNALTRHQKHVDMNVDTLNKYLKKPDIYFCGWDEADTWGNRRQLPFWRYIKDRGAKIFTTSGKPEDMAWVIDANDTPADASWSVADSWHKRDGLTFTYAATFLGPENPDIYRRNKGIRIYFADYDGINEFNWRTGANQWNTFVWRDSNQGYREFGAVYIGQYDIIDTCAWEALREGIDDIRYFTLMRRLARQAMRSDSFEIAMRGRMAEVWFESIDPEFQPDLDLLRRQTVERIIELQNALGTTCRFPEKFYKTKWTKLEKETEIAPMGADNELKSARECAKKNRYDLAFEHIKNARADKDIPSETQIEAVELLASLKSDMLQRKEALSEIDNALKWKISKADRARLNLRKAQIILTPAIFEEIYSEEQLQAAEICLNEALKIQIPGLSPEEKFTTVLSFIRACRSAGLYHKGIAVANDCAERPDATARVKYQLYMQSGFCHNDLYLHKEAVQVFKRALEYADLSGRKEALMQIGIAANIVQDWKTALEAFADVFPMCDKHNNPLEWRYVEAQVTRLTGITRKNLAPSADIEIFRDQDSGGLELELEE